MITQSTAGSNFMVTIQTCDLSLVPDHLLSSVISVKVPEIVTPDNRLELVESIIDQIHVKASNIGFRAIQEARLKIFIDTFVEKLANADQLISEDNDQIHSLITMSVWESEFSTVV